MKDTIKTLKVETALIIVSFHWGTENNSTVTPEQRELGRFAVDMGADLILGHHPHVIQPFELYQGKWIVYSLGNFVFGGNSNPTNKKTEIFQQTFHFVKGQLATVSTPVIIPCQTLSSFKPSPSN